MTRTLNRLTASGCATKKGPRAYADGGHLYLYVDNKQRRRFVFIYARGGRQREISLGPFPALSLADARVKRDQLNAALARGEQLTGPRQQELETFGAVASAEVRRRSSSWRSGESARHWAITLERHCASLLSRPIASITTQDIVRVLKPLHDRAPSFEAITRARIAEVFSYARAHGIVPHDRPDPADPDVLRRLLPAKPKAVHRPGVLYSDVPKLIAELRTIPREDSRWVPARALEFRILTALRAGEACGANWSEIDLDRRLFTVPANRMNHVVPLCERAVEIVRELAPLQQNDHSVFPAARHRGAIGTPQLLRLLGTLRDNVTVHGFRSAFRDWCGNETSFAREVAEAALAHAVGDATERAYRRSDALDKRRVVMDAWGRFCGGERPAKVIALRG
jgi:integrase